MRLYESEHKGNASLIVDHENSSISIQTDEMDYTHSYRDRYLFVTYLTAMACCPAYATNYLLFLLVGQKKMIGNAKER